SCSLTTQPPPTSPLFPYTTLFRSRYRGRGAHLPAKAPLLGRRGADRGAQPRARDRSACGLLTPGPARRSGAARGVLEPQVLRRRSEEHTSELQSLAYLVCRLLLEK